ncbi:Protein C29F5.8 [Aphelenchoides avenae]|nr:Protein C29F5.8 [Aphelenchus avenae]
MAGKWLLAVLILQTVALQNPMMENTQWMAVGFSTDAAMGNDTVLECVFDTQGIGASYISHNEPGYSNIQLLDKSTAALKDGKMMCHVEVDFNSLAKVNKPELKLVQNIGEGKWTLLFAKGLGSADTGEKFGHALSLASDQEVDLCAKCSGRFAVVESDT